MANAPHGGVLKDLFARDLPRHDELAEEAAGLPKLALSDRQLCDLELIVNGGFSPLEGFMNEKDYTRVVKESRLASGVLFPMPITLDVRDETLQALKLGPGTRVTLQDPRDDVHLAIITIEDIYRPDKEIEADAVFGPRARGDTTHPGIDYLLRTAAAYVGGSLEVVNAPHHYDFVPIRRNPASIRQYFEKAGRTKVVAFQTRNPMHHAHLEITARAARSLNAHLLLHPVVGMTKPGDIDHFTRVRAYEAIRPLYPVDSCPQGRPTLSLLPLAMRMAGPREAVWHAIIRKNYGATHFIVGRDHAGPGKNAAGVDWYGPYDAQELVARYRDELGIEMVPFQEVTYLPDSDRFVPVDEVPDGARTATVSGTQLRKLLRDGGNIPSWFSPPAVVAVLRGLSPPPASKGVAVYLAGLPGSGKSKIARALQVTFNDDGRRPVSVLADKGLVVEGPTRPEAPSDPRSDYFDNGVVPKSVGWLNFAALELVRAGAAVVLSSASPADAGRVAARNLVEADGNGFVLVHVATPREYCEGRDDDGDYLRARDGKFRAFPGVDVPFEPPARPDLVVDLETQTVFSAVDQIVTLLESKGQLVVKWRQGDRKDESDE